MPPNRPAEQSALSQAVAELQQNFTRIVDHITIAQQRTAATEARLVLAEAGKKPRMPVEFRSQFGEDLWVWDILRQQTEGFFIEVGAFDGYHFSTTYALESVGWNGLLIEAIPERAEACRIRRPHSRVVRAALGRRGSAGTTTFTIVNDQYGGMLSFGPAAGPHAREVARAGLGTRTITVPLTSMDELLKEHAGPIDAAVIDVEGAEVEVLNGFDLDRFKPRLLILEDNERGKNAALEQYMATKPYIFAGWLSVNRLYVRADLESLLDNLRRF